MNLRDYITQALADIPGANQRIWVHADGEPTGPTSPVHVFWFMHRLCFFVESTVPTATQFDSLLLELASFGAFVRCIENERQLHAALACLRRRYTKDLPCRKSTSTSSSTPATTSEEPCT